MLITKDYEMIRRKRDYDFFKKVIKGEFDNLPTIKDFLNKEDNIDYKKLYNAFLDSEYNLLTLIVNPNIFIGKLYNHLYYKNPLLEDNSSFSYKNDIINWKDFKYIIKYHNGIINWHFRKSEYVELQEFYENLKEE